MSEGFIDKIKSGPEGTLDYINASASDVAPAFRYMPDNLSPSALLKTLGSLGLYVPTKLAAAAASGEKLRVADHRYPIKDVDAALSKANVPITDRFRLKAAMTANQILGN